MEFFSCQTLAPQKVEREPYAGPVIDLATKLAETKVEEPVKPAESHDPFHSRPPTRGGGRNMQESSFSFSGESARRQAARTVR